MKTLTRTQFFQSRVYFNSFFFNSCLVLIALAITTLLPLLYVSQEETVHFWDQAAYHDMTIEKAVSLREMLPLSLRSIKKELTIIYESTGKDYSNYHALVISPMILLFGQSRLVYVLGLSWMYLFPFALALGGIVALIFPANRFRAFWFTVILALITPAVWLPVLNGYPDIGSAAMIVLAVYLYFKNANFNNLWYSILISACLAISILFRRHFAYDVITFFICVSLHRIILAVAEKRNAFLSIVKQLFSDAIKVCIIALGMVLILLLLGWPFIERILHTNFSELYSSYEMPVNVNLIYYFSFYGWISIVAALSVILLIIKYKVDFFTKSIIIFIFLFGCLSLLQWSVLVQQLGFHYTLHFTPWLLISIAVASLIALQTAGKASGAVLIAFGTIYSAISLTTALTYLHIEPISYIPEAIVEKNIASMAFPTKYAPKQRKDYHEIIRLVDYLKKSASSEEQIYIAASSSVLSDDFLWHVYRQKYMSFDSYTTNNFWENTGLNILHWTPFADSRDPYPLEKLLQADYVVITSPLQYHLRVEEQEVVGVVIEAFNNEWSFAKDFKRLPETFKLENNVVAHIYQRIRPTSLPTAIQTFFAMRRYLGEHPGGQLKWLALNRSTLCYIKEDTNKETHHITFNAADQSKMNFLYIDTFQDSLALIGSFNKNSIPDKNIQITLSSIDSLGVTHTIATKQKTPVSDPHIVIETGALQNELVLLTIEVDSLSSAARDNFWIKLNNVKLTENKR